ncbi:MAG: VCBS repeat-containing protein [Armatimonadetes bacterium]|nr:VCBS repeat-containing protein [Armatimonadota bacterium]
MLRDHRPVCLVPLALSLTFIFSLPSVGDQASGTWLLPRKDCRNTARADVAGNMRTAPKEIWSYGSPPVGRSYLRPVTVRGKRLYFAQVRRGVRLMRADGTAVWNRPTLGVSSVAAVFDLGSGGKPVALLAVGTDTLVLMEVASGRILWKWKTPPGAYLGGYGLLHQGTGARLVIFPQNSMLGCCYEILSSEATPRLLWSEDYAGRYWQNYGPYFVFADMDNDGLKDIVLAGKPGYMGVIDMNTGDVKFDLQYEVAGGDHSGRPYGLLHAADIDGDGFRDAVMVSCQVEHYISVLRNNGGKSFSLAWSQFVANDLPLGDKELRPNITSLADVNGDGRKELVIGAFNIDGDNRWHTIVFNAMDGTRLADLFGRYFWGCYDLDGDARPEIITGAEKERLLTPAAAIQAVDGRALRDIGEIRGAGLVFMDGALPDDTAFHARRDTPLYLKGLVVNRSGNEYTWHIVGGSSQLEPFKVGPAAREVLLSEGTLERVDLRPEKPAGPSATWPLVSVAEGRRELVMSLSDGRVIGGEPDLSRSGRLTNEWTVRGTSPSIWIGPDGRRLVCAFGEEDNRVAVYRPSPGECGPEPVAVIETPLPTEKPYSTRSTAELMPFGTAAMGLFVGLRPGVHNIGCAAYDESGGLLWSDELNGPYPRVAAAADIDGDGGEEVFVDNHGKHIIYDEAGNGRVIAHGWNVTIPGRGDGAKYALPIIGPFGPQNAGRIVLGPGLDCLEVLDYTGARLARQDYASIYEFEWCGSSVARIRSDGWDVGMANKDGIFHCADVDTCRTRWKLDLRCPATAPINTSTGDVDGDGRDNFLVALPNGKLVALDEKNGRGVVMWKVAFDAGVDEAFLADVDGDGNGEIVVQLEDGRVKILAARR